MAKIYYQQLIKEISEKTRITQKDVREILEASLNIIIDHVSKEDTTNISNFGTFGFEKRKARTVPNPQDTTKTIDIPVHNILKFYPSISTKEKVKRGKNGK